MNPGRAPLQALFTADRARGNWLKADHMRTRHFVLPGVKTPTTTQSETAWPIQVAGDFAKTTPTQVGPGPRKSTRLRPKRRAAKRSRAHEQAGTYRRRSRSRRRIARRSPFRSLDIEAAICNAGTRSGLTTSPRRRAKPRYPFRSSDSASRRTWTLPRCERRPPFQRDNNIDPAEHPPVRLAPLTGPCSVSPSGRGIASRRRVGTKAACGDLVLQWHYLYSGGLLISRRSLQKPTTSPALIIVVGETTGNATDESSEHAGLDLIDGVHKG
jgi:hypothetical protein